VSIASAPEGVNDLVGALNSAPELLLGNFEPGNIVMVANTKPTKPKTSHRGLGRRDLPQLRDSNGISVRKTGRQTGHGRLVPRAQPQALREKANFGLSQPHFLQRAAHAELAGSAHSGSEIIEIV
jgi:hypothetical protein